MGRHVDARSARMAALGVTAMRAASAVLGLPMFHTETGDPAVRNLNGSVPGAGAGVPVCSPVPSAPESRQ